MSSRYMTTEMSIILVKMSFMNLWKPTRALVSPLGITSHSKDPYRVWKVVVAISDTDEVVGMLQVNLGVDPCLVRSIEQVVDQQERISVLF